MLKILSHLSLVLVPTGAALAGIGAHSQNAPLTIIGIIVMIIMEIPLFIALNINTPKTNNDNDG